LKLKYDESLASFAFNVNLRRYTLESAALFRRLAAAASTHNPRLVGWCKLKGLKTHVESAWFQRMQLIYVETLSSFPFNFNLRRYSLAAFSLQLLGTWEKDVGRCRLTPV
jgi:hypothetical protein